MFAKKETIELLNNKIEKLNKNITIEVSKEGRVSYGEEVNIEVSITYKRKMPFLNIDKDVIYKSKGVFYNVLP